MITDDEKETQIKELSKGLAGYLWTSLLFFFMFILGVLTMDQLNSLVQWEFIISVIISPLICIYSLRKIFENFTKLQILVLTHVLTSCKIRMEEFK